MTHRKQFSVLPILTSPAALLAMGLFGPGCAGAGPAEATAEDTGLEEITVTAEKYNSTIQNTPISLSALSGEQLDAAGITSVEALAREVPGLSVRSAGPAETEIRGARPRLQRRCRPDGRLLSRRSAAVAADSGASRQGRHRPESL